MIDSDITEIFVHCSATPPSADIGVTEIDKWHRKRGWSGIGYHLVIRRNGTLEFGRALSRSGAHVKGHNARSWGVCMVGGIDANGKSENNFTPEQFATLEFVIKALKARAPSADVLGHRDASPDLDGDGVISSWEFIKDCPCFSVRDWWSGVQHS